MDSEKINIGYIVVREDITSPLIRSQVLDILTIVGKEKQVYLLWFYRIDYFLNKKYKKKKLVNDFLKDGIVLVPIPFLAGKFPVSWWQIPLVLPQWLIGLYLSKFFLKINIFHGRSYHAALAAHVLGYVAKVPLVFDPRSPFPEENIAAGRWKSNSLNFVFWKKVEKVLCRSSAATLLTSQAFAQKIKQHTNINNEIIIPNNYPKKFEPLLNRNEVIYSDLDIKLCYVGSLGHWNDLSVYKNFFENLFAVTKYKMQILFLVPENSVEQVYSCFLNSKIQKENFNVKFVRQNNILEEIFDCTAGVYLMNKEDVRLGVKFVEYLASGLPVLVSSNILGAVDYVKEYDVGFLLEQNVDYENVSKFLYTVNENRSEWSCKCKKLAMEKFSHKNVADKLLNVYSRIIFESDHNSNY
jgi:glycosyltransferase involved in cell wall biosynthesis